MSQPKVRKGSKTRAYVRCDVENGMFRGEKIVSLKVMGEDVSVIVNEKSVTNGKLEVNVLGTEKGRVLIGLPGESFSTSRRVWVNQQEIAL